MKRVAWLILPVVWMAPLSAARACDCIGPKPPLEARAESAAVFEGTVIGMVPTGYIRNGFPSRVDVTFNVTRVWKGAEMLQVHLSTPGTGSMCGYSFKAGERYLVYARDDGHGQLVTTLCDRTRPLKEAAEDLKAFSTDSHP